MKKRNLFRTLWTILVLPPLLAMLLLLSPAALADGVDAGTDAIQISPEGAVSLVSGHIAAEGVSSVQFQLRTEGEVSFSFAGDIAGAYLTNCVAGDGTLDVYISGTAPLIAQGYTSRLLGTVSPADKAQPVQSSLQYVYGVSMSAMNTDLSGESGDVLARLQSVLDSATAQFGSTHMYSDESWDRLNAAISAIEQLLESGSVTEEAAAAAIEAYNQAAIGLVVTGNADLGAALATARAVDASRYTPASYQALQAAIAAAEAVQAKGSGASEEDVASALQALRDALNGLVEQQSADGSPGGVFGDGPDGGTRSRSAPAPDETEQSGGTTAPDGTTAPTDTAALSSVPNTGDGTTLLPWLALLCLCGGMLAALAVRRTRAHR